MPTQLHGIADMVARLEKIAEECGEKPKKDAEPKDEFLRIKQRMYALVEQTRVDIHDRQSVMQKRGNCLETIQKGHTVRQHLDELNNSFIKLQELHKRAQGKWKAGPKKQEHQARYQDIRMLKKHKDEINELFLRCASVGGESSMRAVDDAAAASGAKLFGLRNLASPNREEDSRRLLSSEEQDAMKAMRERNASIDDNLEQLSKNLNRLNPITQEIGAAAERQKSRADRICQDVDKAEEDMGSLNKKIKEVMRYDKNTNTCCRLILLLALLCCIGFVFQQLQ
mmetsp:Transcript_67420/g.133015  ORF Transcript_67420/g.133015 Transcript_67420/m.133015 type:complete len:283 (+) Transcript_67420:58-906(+)